MTTTIPHTTTERKYPFSSQSNTELLSLATTENAMTYPNTNCVFPFAETSFGNCTNLLIDIKNCGQINHICPDNYTSCSNGICSTAPDLQLTDPIPIFTAALNGSVDDRFYSVTVPFNITLYNSTTDFVQVTTNGVLCLGNCSPLFTETALPTNVFPGATALPYWDDLYVYGNTLQGIYYQTEGVIPNRTLIFEYYCSHYGQSTEYYHFQVVFFEDKPGIVQYIYYEISDQGASCTVGVQGSSRGPYMQYAFDQANSVRDNMVLTFDTNAGIYTKSRSI